MVKYKTKSKPLKAKSIGKQGRREVFQANGENCRMRPLVSVIEASRKGKKQGNLGELNLEVKLEPNRLLLLGGS